MTSKETNKTPDVGVLLPLPVIVSDAGTSRDWTSSWTGGLPWSHPAVFVANCTGRRPVAPSHRHLVSLPIILLLIRRNQRFAQLRNANRPEFILPIMTDLIADALHTLVDAEARLRALGVVRTRNIVGDVAEHVACERLRLTPAPPCTKGWDATDDQGRRVQIKGIRLPNRQLGILRDMDADHFDRLVVVVFDERYVVRRVLDYTRVEARGMATFNTHQRGSVITLTADLVRIVRDREGA